MEKLKNRIKGLKLADYFRKSSRDGEKQVASIDSQEEECEAFRSLSGLPKAKHVYKESRSAKIAGKRVFFSEMLSLIEEGKVNAILCWHLNRLARNMREAGALIDLLSEGRLIIITPNGEVYDENSDMGVVASLFGMSKQFSMSLSRDVKRGQRTKGKSGLGTGIAPLGFLNSKQGEKGERWWYVDEERFWKIKKLFELFLTGRYSVGKLHKYAVEELKLNTPSRKKLGGKDITVQNTYRMLKHTVYAGFFFVQGQKHQLRAELPRAITEEQHLKVLEMISNKRRPKVQRHKALYSGFIFSDTGDFMGQDVKFQLVCDCRKKFAYRDKTHCPKCKKSISHIENPKYSNQSYYYNNRKKKAKLGYNSISEKRITDTLLTEVVDCIELPSPLLEWSKSYIHELKNKELTDGLNVANDRVVRRAEYERKKTRYREMLRDEKMSDEEYDKDIARLEEQYRDLKQEQVVTDWQNKMEEIIDLSSCMRDVLKNGTFEAKRNILSKLCSNFLWDDEKLIINNKKSIELFIDGVKSLNLFPSTFGIEKAPAKQGLNPDTDQIYITLRRR